jgi:hypothetical protein
MNDDTYGAGARSDDLDKIVADYADDAAFITSSGIMRGKEGSVPHSPHGIEIR